MAGSLFTALSGLQAHQQWIDVIGNNLANANTPGYKSSRAVFSDHFARTLQFASGPGTNAGGRNPVQVGLGVQVADIGRNFGQGALTGTGRPFDLAIEGNGFFSLAGGNATVYTRVGTFGLDALRNLVDQRTGMRVLNPSGQAVEIDADELFPPSSTGSMEFTGNLPGVVTGPLAEVLSGASGLTEGSPAVALGTNTGPFNIPLGETWSMELVIDGGPPLQVSVPGSATPLTTADIALAVDALNGVSAADVGGVIQITSDRTGDESSIKINPGAAGADLVGLLGLQTTLLSGSEVAVNSSTDLNQLPQNTTDYTAGDQIDITGVDTDGSPVNATFIYGADGTTVDDLVNFIDGLYSDATVSLDNDGRILVEAQTTGESSLMLSIMDDGAGSQVGQTQWSDYSVTATTQGTGPDTFDASSEVFDSAGTAHSMTFEFERQPDGSWTLTPSIQAADGQILSNPITGITFGDDGAPTGLGGITSEVTVQFTGQTAPQTIQLDLGTDGEFAGITQFGSAGNVFSSGQDGYGVGELANVSVDLDGVVEGFYTNGQVRELASIGIATFSNPEGLHNVGDNLWIETQNSGNRVIGAGNLGSAGRVIGGSLENSNVDIAEQFVRLIEAQRGFQANARVITTQDEVLAEMVNLI